MKKALAILLAAGMALSLLAGCGGGGTSSGAPAENALVYNLSSEPHDMNSVTTAEGYSMTAIYMIVEGLLSRDAGANPVPGIAESWEFDDATLTYTFHLRNTEKWSTGEPVTAHDFVYAWRKLGAPESTSDYSYQIKMLKNGGAYLAGTATAEELGVKAIDDYTLEVQLEQPCGYALFMFTFTCFFPMNEKAATTFGDTYATEAETIATCGRYNLTEWIHEDHMTFEKNPDYWNADAVKVDKITYTMISDTNAAVNAFKAGEIDILPQISAEQAVQMKDEGYHVEQYINNGARFLLFNCSDPIFSNANIRKAFALGFDRAQLADVVLADGSTAAYSFCPPVFKGVEKSFIEEAGAPFFTEGADKAKEYLEKGMTELGITIDDLNKATIVVDENSIYQKVAAYLLEQWKTNLGVEVSAEIMPKKNRIERVYTSHDFTIAYGTWGPDYNDPNTNLDLFVSDSGNNGGLYNNPRYDELIALAAAESDVATRMAYFAECEQILAKDAVYGPMYFECSNYAYGDHVVNYAPVAWANALYFVSVNQG